MWTQDLISALLVAQEGMDGETFWPCHPAQIESYFGDLFAMALLRKYRLSKTKFRKALDEVPVDILRFHLLSSGIIGLKTLRRRGVIKLKDLESRDFIYEFILSLKRRIHSDIYCRDNENRVLPWQTVVAQQKKYTFTPLVREEERQQIANLNIALESFTWSLYFDLYRDAGMVLHGGYSLPNGLVIYRDFNDLDPSFLKQKTGFSALSIRLLYDKHFSYSFDFANHLVYHDNHLQYLKGFAVFTQGRPLAVRELQGLTNKIEKKRSQMVVVINELSPEQLIWQGAVRYWYLFKNFFQWYHESYTPPLAIKKRVKKWGLRYWRDYYPSKKKFDRNYFKTLYSLG